MEIFENELNDYLKDEVNNCKTCNTEIDPTKWYCSRDCFNADM